MPGSIPSMAVQKKQSVIPSSQGPLSSRSVDSKRKGNGSERAGDNIKPNSQAKKSACSVNMSAQICNTATPRATAVANGPNVDERLRAARERRAEQQKLLASRELSRVQREQRARRYYEQQLQQRKKKLQEQRLKEEKRRAAVEEKRKQRLKEEKERYESAVRRTLEKSQRVQQNPGQNPRGRKLTKNVSYHSVNTTTTTTTTAISTTYKPHYHSGSVHNRPSASAGLNKSEHRSSSLAQTKSARQQDANKKKSNDGSNTRSPVKPAAVTQSRTASPSPERTPRRPISRHSTPLQIELPSVPEEDVAVCSPALSPGNSRPVRTAEGQEEKTRDENPPETRCSDVPHKKTEAITRTAGDGTPQPPEVMFRPSAGTTDPEEASRLLAEKRREARLQREREEQERLQREEAERRSREELEHRRAEERARQQAEAQRLIEEKKRREDEEQRRAEEERAQAMKEAALLQKQRLEEIMRRTRRTDSPDTKSVPLRTSSNEPRPKENTKPLHNGTIEDAIKLPVGTKTSQLGLSNEEDMVPVVAFKERRSLRTLTGLEEIQSHQRAEVI
ncbi:Ensconsin Epithelial microtubule-associated protein of 115 kDa [Collichthys lucidus]|uniref:Ensconsin Epithelial microtubule-associated protein of 115 kDa n=1 Tax=Collichthys lucidus TaxID=240159 RepID=A0A4U5VFH6_COLLU|nr:Ensconsin Epithelial microtubule-associated protein of 115 kDa [Collichthys lucidus]